MTKKKLHEHLEEIKFIYSGYAFFETTLGADRLEVLKIPKAQPTVFQTTIHYQTYS